MKGVHIAYAHLQNMLAVNSCFSSFSNEIKMKEMKSLFLIIVFAFTASERILSSSENIYVILVDIGVMNL